MIQIAQKSRPYSHEFGSTSPIPNTNFTLQVWPTRVRLFSPEQSFEYSLECAGLPENFTLMLDLEKGQIYWFYKTREGFFSWIICAVKGGVRFVLKRAAVSGLLFNQKRMQRGEEFVQDLSVESTQFMSSERLCLGVHKEQDIERMVLRSDLKEMWALYFRLGQYFRSCKAFTSADEIHKAQVSQLRSLLTICPSEHELLGLSHDEVGVDFFARSYKYIRNRFFLESQATLHLMPDMNLFNAGRLVDLNFSKGKVSFIFRKKRVRRMVINPSVDGEIYIAPHKGCKLFRLRRGLNDKGYSLGIDQPVNLKKGCRLYLDNFNF
jgi:hypothetical protein